MRVVAGNLENLTAGETTARYGYPSGACSFVHNMVFESDGTVRRRSGMQAVASWQLTTGSSPYGIAHQLGSALMMPCTFGNGCDSLIMTSDKVANGDEGATHLTLTPSHGYPLLTSIYGLGPSAAIGDYHILPATKKDGSPFALPNVVDATDNRMSYCIASFQITSISPSTLYQLTIDASGPSGNQSATLWIHTPQLEPPFVLDISDIPAVIGNGQANPNYSRDVAARQASYAQNRAEWVRNASSQLTPHGAGMYFLQARNNIRNTDVTKPGMNYGVYGDRDLINTLDVSVQGAAVFIEVGAQYRITDITFPIDWRGVSGSANTQDTLPTIGKQGQIVVIGQNDLVLQAHPGSRQWKEIPRMSISGSLPLVALITAESGGIVGGVERLVQYGDMAPIPTSAPRDMAEMLTTSGAPIRTMYVSGRFCVVCEHAIMVSSASRPLDFFPKSSATITPGDGSIIEISDSTAEFIIDALPVRSGAFVLTNFGAYIVQVADITKVSIQKVRDTTFPSNATHSICGINGQIWHYWHTARDHSVRVYTESDYGSSWQSSNPIPQFDMTHERIPNRAQIIGTSTGDTIFLILDSRIKVLSRMGDRIAVSTISHNLGEFHGAMASGDALLMFVRTASDRVTLVRYDKSAPPSELDGWTRHAALAPVRKYVARNGATHNYRSIDFLPGSGPYLVGDAFFAHIDFLMPPEHKVSTPSAWATLRDITVTFRGTRSAAIEDSFRTVNYANIGRAVDAGMLIQPGTFTVTHPVYRANNQMIRVSHSTGRSLYNHAPIEITRVSYTMTVMNDKSPSAWV